MQSKQLALLVAGAVAVAITITDPTFTSAALAQTRASPPGQADARPHEGHAAPDLLGARWRPDQRPLPR